MENLGIQRDNVIVNFGVGDMVVVLSGAWEGTVGTVQSMNEQKKSLSINVELFGRDTPVELSFSEVKKILLLLCIAIPLLKSTIYGREHIIFLWRIR